MTLAMPIAHPASRETAPELQNGDRLTRGEFERRYRNMPGAKRIELIEGIVYMPSPVRLKRHAQPHAILIGWITHYMSKTPGLIIGDNGTNRLDEDNEPQPDVMLLIPPHAGGAATVDEDDFVTGAPDLVCEVSASSVSIDLHAKKNAYRRNGVREYLVWRTEEAGVDWFILREGRYDPLPVGGDGLVRSETFPGLWLDPAALLKGDLARLFEVVGLGTAAAEHAGFLVRIRGVPGT